MMLGSAISRHSATVLALGATCAAWLGMIGGCAADATGPGSGEPAASVTVTPASASLTVGQTAQLTATPRDAAGTALTGRAVTWSTSAGGVATVSGSGLVTAVAAGSATITATSEGQSGTAAVTVTTGAPPNLVNECSAPKAEWIWCDDFEADRLSSYFEYNASSGSFVRSSGDGVSGSSGMRATWSAGQVGAGNLHLAFGRTPTSYMRPVDAGTADYRDVYWRMYLRLQPGWTGGGGDKLSRGQVFANASWAQAAVGHVWSGSGGDVNYLKLDPVRGTDAAGNLATTKWNDFANYTWLGAVRGGTPLFSSATAGTWYCVEVRMKLNTPGNADGVFQLWIDGALDAEKTGMNWLGDFSAYGINSIFFENYWNAGSPAPQSRYMDNIVVSTARIGC